MAHSGFNRHMYTSQLMLHCWMNIMNRQQPKLPRTHAHAQRQFLTPVLCHHALFLKFSKYDHLTFSMQSMHYLYEHDRPVSYRPRRLACMHAKHARCPSGVAPAPSNIDTLCTFLACFS